MSDKINEKFCTYCGKPIIDNAYVIGEAGTHKLFVAQEKNNIARVGFLFHKENAECFKASQLSKPEQH